MRDRRVGCHEKVEFVKQRRGIDKGLVSCVDFVAQIERDHARRSRTQLIPTMILLERDQLHALYLGQWGQKGERKGAAGIGRSGRIALPADPDA
jgi:hypothetical protein